jgi:hypothetical protein
VIAARFLYDDDFFSIFTLTSSSIATPHNDAEDADEEDEHADVLANKLVPANSSFISIVSPLFFFSWGE